MATRFYFDAANAPAVTPTVISADWEHTSENKVRRLNKSKGSSSLTNNATTYDSADHLADQDAIHYQFVSLPLTAQTISAQTLTIVVRCLEGTANNNLFLTWKVFLINSAGAVVSGGRLLAITRDGLELGTSASTRTDAQTSTQVTSSSQDRICVELGLGGLPTSGSGVNDHDGTLRVGESAASDFAATDSLVTDLNPWLEFANTLTFETKVTVGQKSETDTAQSTGKRKSRAVSEATQTNTAQAVTHSKRKAAGYPTQTNTAQAVTRTKRKVISYSTETETVFVVTVVVTSGQSINVGLVTQTNTAQAVTHAKRKSVGQVAETETRFAVTHTKRKVIGQVSETDSTPGTTHVKRKALGQVSEIELTSGVTHWKRKATSFSTGTSQAFTLQHSKKKSVSLVSSSSSVFSVGKRRSVVVARVAEADSLFSISKAKRKSLSIAGESDVAVPVIGQSAGPQFVDVALVIEVSSVRIVLHIKIKPVGLSQENSTALGSTGRKQQVLAEVIEDETAFSAKVEFGGGTVITKILLPLLNRTKFLIGSN